MAGLLSFSRDDAVALPLTTRTVETVIARTRTANLVQAGLAVSLVAGLVLIGRTASGWISGLLYGLAGGTAIAVALLLMEATLPITAIGAARSLAGIGALVLAGAAGGLTFARLAPAKRAARVA